MSDQTTPTPEIADVTAETKSMAFRYAKRFWYVIPFVILLETALLFATVLVAGSPANKDIGEILIFVDFIPIAAPFAMIFYLHDRIQLEFMEQFASAQHLQFAKTVDIASLNSNATLLRAGHSQRASNVVSGVYKGEMIRLFDYQFTIGSGKSQQTFGYTVFELVNKGTMPHIRILSKKNIDDRFFGVGMGPFSDELHPIQLEGDFYKYFSVFVAANAQIPVREILTPDIMAELEDQAIKLNFELVGSSLFIFQEAKIGNKAQLDAFFDFAKRFNTQTASAMKSL